MLSVIKKRLPVTYKQRAVDLLSKISFQSLSIVFFFPEAIGKIFLTVHARPQYAHSVDPDIGEYASYERFAVVIQGPLKLEREFTLETVRLYARHFPQAVLIVSTWEGEDMRTIAALRTAGAEVICNKKPMLAGTVNINFQIVSTRAGIAMARQLQKAYVIKTRTDQRLYSPFALRYLQNLIEVFPAASEKAGRIVGLSANHIRQKLYHFPDMLLFGRIDDIDRYFSVPLVEQSIRLPFLDEKRPFSAEGYFFWKYAQAIGYSIDFTFENYFTLLAEQFLIADCVSLDWYWYKSGSKYRRFFEYRALTYSKRYDRVDFADWLDLYKRLSPR